MPPVAAKTTKGEKQVISRHLLNPFIICSTFLLLMDVITSGQWKTRTKRLNTRTSKNAHCLFCSQKSLVVMTLLGLHILYYVEYKTENVVAVVKRLWLQHVVGIKIIPAVT